MFTPLTKQTLVENIIQTLLVMIAKGDLRPGSALPSERDLASELNVSRTSVREALKALAFSNIVVIKPGSGTYLSEKSISAGSPLFASAEQVFTKYKSDYKQILEARRILESEMAAITASCISDAEVEELAASLSRMGQLLDDKAFDAFTIEDLSFHNTICRFCKNQYLYDLYNQLFSSIVDIAHLGENLPDRHIPAYKQHVEIFESLKVRDSVAVRGKIKLHIDFCEENVNMFFRTIDT